MQRADVLELGNVRGGWDGSFVTKLAVPDNEVDAEADQGDEVLNRPPSSGRCGGSPVLM